MQSVRLSIIDDDTVGSVSFSSPQYSIREDGLVTSPITLQRSGGSFGFIPVVVRLESVNGGATAGVDFVPGDFLFTFGDGNLNQRVASMILDNQVFEGDEDYRAVLRLAPGAPATASLGAITTTSITIVEDDPNHPPTVSQIFDQGIQEDGVLSHLPFTVGDEEHDLDSLSITAVAENGALIPASGLVLSGSGASRSLLVRPYPNQSGVSKVTVRVDDGFDATEMSFNVEVEAVNDPPEIQEVRDVQVQSGSGAILMEFVVGDLDSPSTALETSFVSSNPILLPDAAIESVGTGFRRTMRITPPTEGEGTVLVLLNVKDELTTVSARFVITVVASAVGVPVDPPASGFSLGPIAPISVAEDEIVRVPLDVRISGALAGPLTFDVSGGDDSLIQVSDINVVEEDGVWTMSLEPLLNQSGLVDLTLRGSDGSLTISRDFQVIVNPVNDPPVVDPVPLLILDEDGEGRVAIRISDVDSALDTLSLEALRANAADLLPAHSLVAKRTEFGFEISVSPSPNLYGETQVDFDLVDGEAIVPVSFLVQVNPINDAPFFETLPLVQGLEGDPLNGLLRFGDIDSLADALVLRVSSLNESLLPLSNISLSGTGLERLLTIVPGAGQSGKGAVLLTLTDGDRRIEETLVVTVLPKGRPPFIDFVPAIELEEDAEQSFAFGFGDEDTPIEGLVLSVGNVDPEFFGEQGVSVSGAGGQGLLSVKPLKDQAGDSEFQILVTDGTTITEFPVAVRVNEVNDPPSLSPLPGLVLAAESQGTVSFTVSDPDTDADKLLIAAVSLDSGIVRIPTDGLKGTGEERELTIQAVSDQGGTAEIILGVSDGVEATTARFSVTVTPKDGAPVIVGPAPRVAITVTSNGIQVTWDSEGVLEQASDPRGPYQALVGAVSPYVINSADGDGAVFFRVTRP